MNTEMIEKARARIPSVPVLVNLVSQRTRQLNRGERPFVKPLSPNEDKADIALREIAEGLIVAEVDFDAITRKEEEQTRWTRE